MGHPSIQYIWKDDPFFMSNFTDPTQEELRLLGEEFKSKFSISSLQTLANQTGMVRRNRKCRAQDLVSLCVFLSQTIGTESLVSLCAKLSRTTGVSLSAQGLNERFNERTVQFLKRLFLQVFQKKICPVTTSLVNRFTRIRILDSTSFQLPSSYADTYKGHGGGGSEAGLKIQLEYDLISGEFLETHVGNAVSNDCRYGQKRTQTLDPGELSLRDLGYFSMDDLEKISERQAFYVSRIRWNTQVYQKGKDGTWILLNLEELTKELTEGQTLELSDVYIGFHQKHKTRLVIYRLTEAEWTKRLAHHKKEKKKMPKLASRINLLITNVSKENLPYDQVYGLYSLRWQIEILFKTWKSIFRIHQVKPMKIERFQCHLYGQLIGLCLVASITYRMRKWIWEKKQKEISEYKCVYIIQIYFLSIHDVLFKTFQHPVSVLTRLFQELVKNGGKARRYKKRTPFDILGITQEYTMGLHQAV
jgi:hypothetical protein